MQESSCGERESGVKTLNEFAAAVGRDASAVRKRALKAGVELQWAISPTSGQRVLVLSAAAEKELLKLYPTGLRVLK
jgi:hypothetical protein